MKPPYELVAPIESKRGKGKTRWVRIGVAFVQPDGRIDAILEAVPLPPWDGRFYLFPREVVVDDEGREQFAPPVPKKPVEQPEWARYQPKTSASIPETPLERGPQGGTYKAKVHKQHPTEARKGICGFFVKWENRAVNWKDVTCKLCLKERGNEDPPDSPDSPESLDTSSDMPESELEPHEH
ncbi:hypothetical protein Rctr197k_158 [Virus Rctr197k]|nr:hypothetical protein Rctr197k_158 [Virus Rctr197k]